MLDHEEFLTKEDFRAIGEEVSDEELERVNGHPGGDGERSANENKIDIGIDEDVIGHTPDGRPVYRSDDIGEMYRLKDKKENDRFEEIFYVYSQKKREMEEKGDNRHIFLLKKNEYVTGFGRDRRYGGWLFNDVLAVTDKDHKGALELVASLDRKGKYSIYYSKNDEENGKVSLDPRTKLCKSPSYIDLNGVKDADSLRSRSMKRSA